MNLTAIRQQLDLERRTLTQDAHTLEILPDITRIRAADGSHHSILFSALSPANADAAIAREAAHHRALGAEVEWKAYAHDTPPALLARLERHGFTRGPQEAVLVMSLDKPPQWVTTAPQYHVLRVQTEPHVRMFRNVAEEIFGKDYSFTA